MLMGIFPNKILFWRETEEEVRGTSEAGYCVCGPEAGENRNVWGELSGGCYGVCDVKPLLDSSIKFSGKSPVLPDTWTHTDSFKGLSGECWSGSQKPGRQPVLACSHWVPTPPHTQSSLPPYGVNATEAEIETQSGYTRNHHWWCPAFQPRSVSFYHPLRSVASDQRVAFISLALF